MTTLTASIDDPSGRTRGPSFLAFRLGAGIDFVLGLDLLLFGGWAAGAMLPDTPELFGLATATVFRIAGALLLVIAVDTWLMVRSNGRLHRFLPVIMVANWAAVPLCLGLMALGFQALSAGGMLVLAAVAAGSAALALAQRRELRSPQ